MRVWQAQRFLLPQGRVILIFPQRSAQTPKPGEGGRFTIFIFDAKKDFLLNFSETTGEPGTDLVARIGVQSGPMSL